MMNRKKINRTKFLQVRVTTEEFITITKAFENTTDKKISEFIRKKLLDKPFTIYHRNQSLDDLTALLSVLIRELNAIGNNYNQVVKKLHRLDHLGDIKSWLLMHDRLIKIVHDKISEIKFSIAQISDQWLQ